MGNTFLKGYFLNDIRGMKVSFGGNTQLGWTSMEMYILKYDFGSDLKEQKLHLQRLYTEYFKTKGWKKPMSYLEK